MSKINREECLFCNISSKKEKSHIVWESDTHIAFLSIFPNTEGVTVVIPKEHYDSYIFDQTDDVMVHLMKAAKTVAKLLDKKLNVERTALILEGYGINHLHVKLYPLHGIKKNTPWKPLTSSTEKRKEYSNVYQGYISSHDCEREDDKKLSLLAEKIKNK